MVKYEARNFSFLTEELILACLISFSLPLHTCCGSHIDPGAEITAPGVDGGLVGAARCQMVKLSLCGVWRQGFLLHS